MVDRTRWVAQELAEHADAQESLAKAQSTGDGGEAKLSETELQALRDLGYVQ